MISSLSVSRWTRCLQKGEGEIRGPACRRRPGPRGSEEGAEERQGGCLRLWARGISLPVGLLPWCGHGSGSRSQPPGVMDPARRGRPGRRVAGPGSRGVRGPDERLRTSADLPGAGQGDPFPSARRHGTGTVCRCLPSFPPPPPPRRGGCGAQGSAASRDRAPGSSLGPGPRGESGTERLGPRWKKRGVVEGVDGPGPAEVEQNRSPEAAGGCLPGGWRGERKRSPPPPPPGHRPFGELEVLPAFLGSPLVRLAGPWGRGWGQACRAPRPPQDAGAGLLAAAMIAVVPGYISRSVAGSYDNEGIAIFCMLLTYYMWIKAVKTGSIYWAAMCALAYFYMPVLSSEHMAAFGVFGLCQIHAFVDYLRSKLSPQQFETLFRSVISLVGFVLLTVGTVLMLTGKISPWTGRFYSLLDPSYAKNNIPIIASVSEHQPTTWSSYYFDLQLLVFMFPVGLYYCFRNLSDARIFIIMYGVTSMYFSAVMVRLMLVLAPVMCILSGIGVSQVLSTYMKNLDISRPDKKSKKQQDSTYPIKNEVASGMILVMAFFLITYTFHSTWVTSEAYSSPSIVLSARGGDGSRIIFDDFREAYYWLRHNTPEDAKVMSWWDYGYQITAMANRTILVDNNTWNNTHISRVGQAMASTEEKAYEIMRELDVSYVLVIFGGLTGYSSDDINKFLWMVRIGGSTDTGKHIKEHDYYTATGEFRVDREGSPVLLNCLMYKMCYYRFGQVYTEAKRPPGYDRVRNAEIGNKDFELDVLEEAYTTEHWLVRIYKVKDLDNRGLSRT
uniref:Dolichyl-diphosphooligosaccharide--protein glycosyltransferase subunit STT3A n=1 Tax=Ornithorhynchus anatinus TaxID=9258 RepID=A0A6I8P762_ORNAN